jgi:nitrate/TMAO reductase-like tetraheme cytochrome c subunit
MKQAFSFICLVLLGGSAPGALAAAGGTCADCHSYMSKRSQTIVAEWKASIHAKKGIGCADCHGGNPRNTTIDGSMWNVPGFKGRPRKQDIPALCAKCHANPAYMRPFNISSTSQFAEYKQSVHGKRLLQQGDTKVAACTDCHGIHDLRAANDVRSLVYKTNIPKTCARCHADEKYMKPYGIPTNQYAEYVSSYHGRKLLKEQDKAAPACSDCHGTHGATPPGVKEVPNVCGTCHSRTQEYFDKGPHWTALQSTGVPRCVNCHGNHAIAKSDDSMLAGTDLGHCGSCHPEGTSQYETAGTIHKAISGLAGSYESTLRMIHLAEEANMDMQDQLAELENAKTNLIAARALQHTVTPKTVEEAVRSAAETIDIVNRAARAALARSHRRNISLLAMGLMIVFTSAVLYWKWRLAFYRWLSGSAGPSNP